MASAQPSNADNLRHRSILAQTPDEMSNPAGSGDGAKWEDVEHWHEHAQRVKVKILQQVQDQLSDILDKELTGPVHASVNRKTAKVATSRSHKMDDGKVFMDRASLLDELFMISHIRTIYHMFVAVLLIFCVSTLAVDYIDQGRLVLEFDLLFDAFGKMGTVAWVWALMFVYSLLVPYYVLLFWAALYHRCASKLGSSLGTALVLAALQISVLGLFPVHMVVRHQLPPASRFIVVLEQIRFLMKSYSFMRETAPVVMKKALKPGEKIHFPTFSSYLYFLFCPTLVYRESYPRNTHIRWKYVAVTVTMILGCLFYGYFILVRLCVPVFTSESQQPFGKRAMVLAVFHSILPGFCPLINSTVNTPSTVCFPWVGRWAPMNPWLFSVRPKPFQNVARRFAGIMLLLLCFFAFLHCWLNLFGELLRFADRMFYKDWWNSTSFANYYRTWNVVVHDWLYYYGYRDFLWLSKKKFRTAAMLSVFIVSAVVHEYALAVGFGFFYPVMFCLFAIFGVVFNFTMNDKRQNPVFNIIMWACLFLGQGVQVCLYCQEWYAQIRCPRTGNSFWELVTPRSWSCGYQG